MVWKLDYVQAQEECIESEFYCLHNAKKPLFLKELKDVWGSSSCKGKYSASNTLLIDDEPHTALLNPVCSILKRALINSISTNSWSTLPAAQHSNIPRAVQEARQLGHILRQANAIA